MFDLNAIAQEASRLAAAAASVKREIEKRHAANPARDPKLRPAVDDLLAQRSTIAQRLKALSEISRIAASVTDAAGQTVEDLEAALVKANAERDRAVLAAKRVAAALDMARQRAKVASMSPAQRAAIIAAAGVPSSFDAGSSASKG